VAQPTFRIRDLIMLVLVVGLVSGYWIQHRRVLAERQKAAVALRQAAALRAFAVQSLLARPGVPDEPVPDPINKISAP
jgi:hypothetical protein